MCVANVMIFENTGEFRTSNLVDMLQIQLAKMFGHHFDSYAFGHGVDKFPAWMKKHHPDRWKGFKRLVGNRAQIFLENSVAMYYMASYYLEYCEFVLLKAKTSNKLHKRLVAKLRSSEMLAGLCMRCMHHIQVYSDASFTAYY